MLKVNINSTGKIGHYSGFMTVFNYLEATPNSKSFIEEVLNLILMGIIEEKINFEGFFSYIKPSN